MAEPKPSQADPLLLPLLHAQDNAEAQRRLESLLNEHAAPIIRGIVRRRWRLFTDHAGYPHQTQDEQDSEDVRSEVVSQLLVRLRDLKAHSDSQVISNFRAYVAVTTYRACDECLRQKHPQRQRLKNRLRYLLSHQPQLALWPGEEGEWLCGLAPWRQRKTTSTRTARVEQLRDDPQGAAQAALPDENVRRMNPTGLVTGLFQWLGEPIELELLVNAVADLWGIKEQTFQLENEGQEVQATTKVATEVDQRAYLKRLWAEIRQLQPHQSAVLLLNLRDAQGRGVIALLRVIGIASMREIAQSLTMSLEELAGLWNDLPLDDATIAQRLDLTRRQVINLRRAVRERLARRMAKFEET